MGKVAKSGQKWLIVWKTGEKWLGVAMWEIVGKSGNSGEKLEKVGKSGKIGKKNEKVWKSG